MAEGGRHWRGVGGECSLSVGAKAPAGLDMGVGLWPCRRSLPESPLPLAVCGLFPASPPGQRPRHPILPASSHRSICGPRALAAFSFAWGLEPVTSPGAEASLLPQQPSGCCKMRTSPASGPLPPPLAPVSTDSKSIKLLCGPCASCPPAGELSAVSKRFAGSAGLGGPRSRLVPWSGAGTGVLGAVGTPGFEQQPLPPRASVPVVLLAAHPVPVLLSGSGACLDPLFPAIFPDAPSGTHSWGQGPASAWL